MLTEKDYCDYETCVALKELGFNALVDWYFNEDKSIVSSLARYRNTYIPRISLYEAQKWLREEKFLLIVVDRLLNGEYVFSVVDILNYSEEKNGIADSYEKALFKSIKDAVKILKEK